MPAKKYIAYYESALKAMSQRKTKGPTKAATAKKATKSAKAAKPTKKARPKAKPVKNSGKK